MNYKTVPVKYNIYEENDNPVFGNSVLSVSIEDDAAGPYIEIEQCREENNGKVLVEMDQIDALVNLLHKLKSKWEEE